MADSGEGPEGPGPPVFLDQTDARRAEEKFFFFESEKRQFLNHQAPLVHCDTIAGVRVVVTIFGGKSHATMI